MKPELDPSSTRTTRPGADRNTPGAAGVARNPITHHHTISDLLFSTGLGAPHENRHGSGKARGGRSRCSRAACGAFATQSGAVFRCPAGRGGGQQAEVEGRQNLWVLGPCTPAVVARPPARAGMLTQRAQIFQRLRGRAAGSERARSTERPPAAMHSASQLRHLLRPSLPEPLRFFPVLGAATVTVSRWSSRSVAQRVKATGATHNPRVSAGG